MEPAMTAPSVPLVPQGWQPISTAPKDGTEVLLFSERRIVSGSWNHGGAMLMPHWMGGIFQPTHWMPIPPLPSLVPDPEEDTKRTI